MTKSVFVFLCAILYVPSAFCQFGFLPSREDRRLNTFRPVQNFLQNAVGTIEAVLNFGPNREPPKSETPSVTPPSVDENNRISSVLPPGIKENNGIPIVTPPGIEESNGRPSVVAPGIEDNNGTPSFTPPVVEENTETPSVPPAGIEENNETPSVPPTGVQENNGTLSVPSTGAEENNGTQNIPPTGVEENNGTPSVPPTGVEENNGTPSVPPTGVEENNGTSSVPPTGAEENNGTPSVRPPGVEQNEVEQCETEKGGSGSGRCVPVVQCQPYLELLQKAQRSPAEVEILRKAYCGFEGGRPKVCCPVLGIPISSPSEEIPTEAPVLTTEAPKPSSKTQTDEDYIDSFPEPPVCGVSNASLTKVVGGVDAQLGDYPWVALLGYLDERLEQGVLWKCGGSLVSTKHVLTAAHCIHGHEDKLYLVRVGELDLARDDEGATPVDVLVKSKIKHEGYDSKSYVNDIGLLVLQREIKFTPLIQPICIPVDSEMRARSYVDYNPIIAGWGETEFRGPKATHLQALQLPVVTNEQCANAFKQYTMQVIDERVLCAGYKNGGKDACQGDSGGPLMQPIWNSRKFTSYFYQIGVVSYGRRCAEAGFPGVYTRVTHFVPWLQEKMLRKV